MHQPQPEPQPQAKNLDLIFFRNRISGGSRHRYLKTTANHESILTVDVERTKERGRLCETQIICNPCCFHPNTKILISSLPFAWHPGRSSEAQALSDSVCPAKFAKSCVSDSRPLAPLPDNEIEIAYQ
jgi:hypothetical protein